MRIYTRKGDDGTTGLLFGGRVRKSSPRPAAYGEVDEAQAVLGLRRGEAHRVSGRLGRTACRRVTDPLLRPSVAQGGGTGGALLPHPSGILRCRPPAPSTPTFPPTPRCSASPCSRAGACRRAQPAR